MRLFALLFTACLLGLGQAQHCTVACPNSIPQLINPKAQSTYVYTLDAKTVLTPRDSQKVTIKADAEVAIVSACEAVLRLQNVAIDGVPNGAELASELASKSFAFGYFNGRILGVCPANDDQDWSLNIKKAIVSALQVQFDENKDKVEESDFSGRCPTEYRKIRNEDNMVVMEKRKDLNLCDDRRIDLRQTPDQALGQLKEMIRHYMHPMDSDLSCRMTLKDQVVSEVDCEERHVLVHRSHKPVHLSYVKMMLKESKDGVAADLGQTDSEPKRPYLSFDHKHKNPTETDVVEVLKKLCSEISEPQASIETSFTFQKLVDKLRYLSAEETASVDESVKTSVCPAHAYRIRELFLDASAFAASDGSIRTLVKAHENQELSITRSTALFTVVAMKAAPNKETVQVLLPVIASEKTIRPMLLGFSVLVRRYCEKSADCASNSGVKDARDAYLARLATAKDANERMTIVRALENLNVNTEGVDNMINAMDEIIKSDAEPALRAAAVNALPNDASHMDRYKSLVMDESMPNEARIAAFQKMMKNGGMSHIKDLFTVKGECMKNYVLTYVDNLKKSKNDLRRQTVSGDVELPEQPKREIGITRNIAREYGPYTFEYDVIYPETHENVTRSINGRLIRAKNDQLKEIVEIQITQNGFERELTNAMALMEKKSFQSIMQFINGKNVYYTDVFQDLKKMKELIIKRAEKIINEKKVDRSIGGVLLDSKLVLPTITGLPLMYKFGDNFLIRYDGEFSGEKGDRHIKLNGGVVAGVYGQMKLLVKDQKMGYEYDGKLAYTPMLDMDIQKKEHSLLLRFNTKDVERRTIMRFKQSLREKRATGEEKDYENEITPESRSDQCFSFFLLDYCRKASHIKGLIFPNVEYYVVKPEKEVTALELLLKGETEDKTRRYVAELTAVGSPSNKQAKAQIEVIKGEEYKITLKSPEHEFNTEFTIHADKNNLKMHMDFPNMFQADLTGTFQHDKENNVRKNQLNLQYKFAGDEKPHTVDYENEFSFNLKRSSKDKNSGVDYRAKYMSSHFPILNHKVNIQFKYRPFKVNELNLEGEFGRELQHKFQLMRNSQIEVEEVRPFKMHGNSDIKLMANDLDIDYDLKSEFKYESNKGTPLNRSKRAADLGAEDVEGVIDYKNNGSPIDSKMHAHLKMKGNNYGYDSELKQTQPQQYEGKITLSKNDKKIFINHKSEMTKPTNTFHLKTDADVSYSDSDMKKHYQMEFKKENDIYTMRSTVERNGQMFYENHLTIHKGGKLNLNYRRNDRKILLDLDNALSPREGTMKLNIKDREYNFVMKREPLRFRDITVEGNENAYIKNGKLHLSLMDPSTLSLVTKADGKIDMTVDLISPVTKRASLKIDSKKYNLFHEGELSASIVNPRLSWHQYTKRDSREYKSDVELSLRSSDIALKITMPDYNSKIHYSRQGDQINMDIDGTLIEGHAQGTIREGKIHIKGRQTDFEIESNYRYEDGKLIIEPVKSENGKLEGVLSRKVPSHLTLETPRVKMNMKYDRYAPVKVFKLDYDGIHFEKHTDIEYEPGVRYKIIGNGKLKDDGRHYSIDVQGIPRKAFNLDADLMDFKLKVSKPEDSNKAQFSYTFNEYTETEEYEFDPHRAYYVNWLSSIRKYIQNFIVEDN
ncbi:apolipophorin [Dermatophagoides farinae]|uniref:Apolipophorin n=1 Tax=Dermatophagoides farinae TaxID=6954 RepID=A0A9D4SFK4_DERFA|nr:apolipophorin [Dermatophagoides farinae]